LKNKICVSKKELAKSKRPFLILKDLLVNDAERLEDYYKTCRKRGKVLISR